MLCGLAPSLPLLLLFRVIQGLGGGGLQPSEQSILADTFPPPKRGQAFAVYGLAVVTAPIVGPTLGGSVHQKYLVQHVQAASPAYLQQAGSLTRHLLTNAAASADAQAKAILLIYRSVQAQASVLSYIDILHYLSIICGGMIPLVFLTKRPPKGTQAAVH